MGCEDTAEGGGYEEGGGRGCRVMRRSLEGEFVDVQPIF